MVEFVVQQQYDQLAKIYDQRWKTYIENTLNFTKQWANIPPEATVLDIACGTGEFERLLLQDNPNQHMLGVDISTEMLAIARQKLHHCSSVRFEQGSATELPSANEQFDIVVCASSFHYFDQPVDALAEMKRVIKPGGKVVILDWCKDYLLCRLYDAVLKLTDPGYRQCYTQSEFHSFFSTAQLTIQAATKIRFGLAWEFMIVTATNTELRKAVLFDQIKLLESNQSPLCLELSQDAASTIGTA
ncbi:methyltransferase domain-containing protein [Phormidium sp. CLA17]|uniref:class I SAM-dependent methyltransferase n=1 Tax=Leptolyngbya sp. Cla-17 TaxID=2803751 RepID=UPI001491F898|nr:methyltransferase domain-containing protein [Leptolyngbya sp. Cla-17]MBM0742344.1 methyltransferase domain-containing protein [Leptolyngbya sp. Cla-17]